MIRYLKTKLANFYPSLKIAMALYCLPALLVVFELIDSFTFNFTGAFFFSAALFVLLPGSLAGIILNMTGLIRSNREKDQHNKNLGELIIVLGIMEMVGGVFGWMLLYVLFR